MNITVFAAGYSTKIKCAYAAALTTDSEPPVSFNLIKPLEGTYTKNQMDLIATTMALRSIKPDYQGANITLNVLNYVMQVIERGDDGCWLVQPKVNINLVEEIRLLISEFPNLKIIKIPANGTCAELTELIKSAESICKS